MTKALHLRQFRRLVASYGLNELTWSFGTIALAVLVYGRTGDVAATAGLFAASSLAPGLLAPALVARLDHRRPGRVLAVLYAAETALFALLAATGDALPVAAILLLALADGAVAVVGRALSRAAVATELEPRGLLREGNAVLNVVFSACLALGPAAAGALQALSGPRTALAVAAGLFALAALVVLPLPTAPATRVTGDRAPVRTTLRALIASPVARGVLVLHGVAFATACAVTPVEVALADRVLDGGAGTYGAMLAAWGAGSVLGSALFARLAAGAARLVAPAFAVMAAGLLLVAATDVLAVVLLGCAVGGAGNGVGYVAVVQALQDSTPVGLRARVQGVLESVNATATGTGYLAGGTLGTLAGPRAVFAVAGGLVLVAACAALARRATFARRVTA
jgi:MFS transporter, DHA3 family, macrolide efflux protein